MMALRPDLLPAAEADQGSGHERSIVSIDDADVKSANKDYNTTIESLDEKTVDETKSADENTVSSDEKTVDENADTSDDNTRDLPPIIYHYLTFETPLPPPSTISPNPPAPPPDLQKYTSPFEWPESRKNFMIWLSCLATLITAYTAGAYAAAAAQMAAEWHVSETAVVAGITTFCTGFAIAPMVLAPFSEINGRYPVFVGAGILFVICQIACAVTHSYPGMLVARFWVGCGSSVFSTMVGGVVADLYHAEGRNTPMALFSGGALVGTGLGPLVSGFIAQHTHWRWVFWVQVITCTTLIVAVTIGFRETRGSILLSRKAAALNAWYAAREQAGHAGFDMALTADPDKVVRQRIRWRVKADEERQSIAQMIGISVYRPFHLLVTEPVVFFFSLWVAFAWAVLYLTFGSIPLVFTTSHHFTLSQSDVVFAAMIAGAILSSILSIYQDRLLASYLASRPPSAWLVKNLHLDRPEGRLYFACLESAFLPLGLFWFGWTQFPSIPWIVPALGITCATMGIYSVYLATFNYLADSYHRYASSALAAQSFCRNILGGIFPLVTVQMFRGLSFQGAASLLGGIALLLTAVPWVLVVYGPEIRRRSTFAREIM
jgi:multidrug resistance protein